MSTQSRSASAAYLSEPPERRADVPPTVTVPPLGPPPRTRRPRLAERVLDSGLRVLAVRMPGVPLVEVRLRVPFVGSAPSHPARSGLMAETVLAGTERRSQVELAEALGSLGASLGVSVDADRMLLGGAVLRGGLTELLGLMAEVVTEANYPREQVAVERDRLVERLSIARSQPTVAVREALRRRMFGNHPYARELPQGEAVAAVTPGQLRRLHAERVLPSGALLVLVGDLSPARVLDQVADSLSGWTTSGEPRLIPELSPVEPGPTLIVHRPGGVQSSIRMGASALRRDDPSYAALQLANLIFGGYFSSRLMANIREDKGYTYSPHSRVDHGAAGSTVVIDADVATEVTAPALLEIGYELGRLATVPARQEELDDVRQYAIGTLALSTATQAGFASTLSALAGVGLTDQWLRDHPARLARITLDDVTEVAHRVLAPARFATVVLGDATRIEGSVDALGPVERA